MKKTLLLFSLFLSIMVCSACGNAAESNAIPQDDTTSEVSSELFTEVTTEAITEVATEEETLWNFTHAYSDDVTSTEKESEIATEQLVSEDTEKSVGQADSQVATPVEKNEPSTESQGAEPTEEDIPPTESEIPEEPPVEVNKPEEVEEMVWIPQSGSKYHSRSSCSNMKNPTQVTKSQAENSGYEPCKKCH